MTFEKIIEQIKHGDCMARLPDWPEGHRLVFSKEYLHLIDKNGNILKRHKMHAFFRTDWELEYKGEPHV